MVFHKNKGNSKYSGIMLIVQKTGTEEAKTITNFVKNEVFESSSQLSFLKVVKRHAKDAKLKMARTGGRSGKIKIKRTEDKHPKTNSIPLCYLLSMFPKKPQKE